MLPTEEEQTLKEAKKFHGHLGPYLALGLKAGLLARERLHAEHKRLSVRVTLKLERPVSCFLDGIQVSSGCTLGKGNITAKDGEGITASFTAEDSKVTLKARSSLISWIQNLKVTKQNEEDISRQIMLKKPEELFEISQQNAS